MATIRVRGDASWNGEGGGGLGRNGNKLSDSRYIFQVEPSGIRDALAIGYNNLCY